MNVRILPKLTFLALLGLALVLLSGCSTINSRISANSALFDSLPLETQENLRKGVVQVGYTQDMVYIAMGEPNERRGMRSASTDKMTWIYNTYYHEWVGRVHAGYRRVVITNKDGKVIGIYHEPVYEDIYRDRKEERIRITFKDGAVGLIEERER